MIFTRFVVRDAKLNSHLSLFMIILKDDRGSKFSDYNILSGDPSQNLKCPKYMKFNVMSAIKSITVKFEGLSEHATVNTGLI